MQPYKYNGKELDTQHGLNMYDYSARYMDPAIGRFTSVDPLAEKYYSISPYVYCANNPMRFVDPDGKHPILRGMAQAAKKAWKPMAAMTANVSAQISVNMAKGDNMKEALGNMDVGSVVTTGVAFSMGAKNAKNVQSAMVVADAAIDISVDKGVEDIVTGSKSKGSATLEVMMNVLGGKAGEEILNGLGKSLKTDMSSGAFHALTKGDKEKYRSAYNFVTNETTKDVVNLLSGTPIDIMTGIADMAAEAIKKKINGSKKDDEK